MALRPPRGVRGPTTEAADLHPRLQAGDHRTVRPAHRSARAARCCAGRACTTPISSNGVRPERKGRCQRFAQKPAGRPARSAAEVDNERLRRRTRNSPPSWPGRKPRWRSREKYTRSWRLSPRARIPTRSRAGDRRGTDRAGTIYPGETACPLLGKPRATLHRQRNPRQRGKCLQGRARRIPRRCARRAGRCSRCSTRTGSPTSPRPRSGRCCSTRAPTWPASPPCTGCCGRRTRSASDAPRPPTRPGSVPS